MIKDRGLNWWVWRPIIAGITTYTEVMEIHTLSTLIDAHSALDIKQEIDDLSAKIAEEQRERQEGNNWS